MSFAKYTLVFPKDSFELEVVRTYFVDLLKDDLGEDQILSICNESPARLARHIAILHQGRLSNDVMQRIMAHKQLIES